MTAESKMRFIHGQAVKLHEVILKIEGRRLRKVTILE